MVRGWCQSIITGPRAFTPAFGASTRTEGGLELVLGPAASGEWLPLRANRRYAAVVRSVHRKGDTPIAAGTMVLSVVEAGRGGCPRSRRATA